MKTVVIFSVLLAQSSASFISELTETLGSVKSSVGKLFSDVGHDLKETLDCTIDAVEEVLYDKDQIPKYYDKCRPTTSTESNNFTSDEEVSKSIGIYIPVSQKQNSQIEFTPKSINLVTSTKDIDKKLARVEEVVNNEYYRVDNMSFQLGHKLDGMSKNVDMQLKKIEDEKVDLHATLLEIEKLHLQEQKDIKKTKDEIHSAFEILKKIGNYSYESHPKNVIESVGEKTSSKTILQNKLEEIEREELKNMKNATKNVTLDTTKSNTPRTFKDVASSSKISKQKSTINPNNKYILSSTESQLSSPTFASSLETVTQALNTTIEPISRVSITSTVAYTKPVIEASNTSTIVNYIKPATHSAIVTTTTVSSTQSVSQTSIPTTTTETTETVTRSSTPILSTKGTTEPVIGTLMTTKTFSATEPPALKPKKRKKKNKIMNKDKRTAEKHHKTQKTTTTNPPDDYDGLVSKNPKLAAAEALKVFSKSIKTKSVLDNFFKHLEFANSGI